ncbi:polyprenyl synthetase family protein [Streptomyces odontomachi]|uniref:polyprenyl synthetase family protein n=1 Tax=Streptomyces odontomachi TaxID=2944940 RepID=UPI00210EB0F9|nr:polyprenyl synthetase family protein [Streptomyces sp. ODS25]
MLGLRLGLAEGEERVEPPSTASDAIKHVEAVLGRVLDTRMREARATDPVFARDVAGRVAAFVRHGGKRLRTAFTWCGWRAAGGSGDAAAVLDLGAALELLQACALVQDDVMDGSPLRRGAPALHVDLARMHRAAGMSGSPESFATSAAVLAGDLALVWADDLLTETALGSPYGSRLHDEWRAMREEMVAGQYRDIHAQATGSSGVDEVLATAVLKSALYTVARPLTLGASLAGADEHTMEALRSAGRCAGLAFQLRDDLLGAFGDPAATGKPAGDDLSSHKLTYLLTVALGLARADGDEEAAAVLAAGGAARQEHTVECVRAALERTGARAVVESRIAELAVDGLRHFARTDAAPAVRREFAATVQRASGLAGCHIGEVA